MNSTDSNKQEAPSWLTNGTVVGENYEFSDDILFCVRSTGQCQQKSLKPRRAIGYAVFVRSRYSQLILLLSLGQPVAETRTKDSVCVCFTLFPSYMPNGAQSILAMIIFRAVQRYVEQW
jgi:hypothetical protein